MKIVSGTFNGTGAALFICCGFIPDEVHIWGLEDGTNNYYIRWFSFCRALEVIEGVREGVDTGRTWTELTYGTGVQPYEGGDLLTATLQTSTTYGEGVYLGKFHKDVRYANNLTVNPGDGSGATINSWTLDTAANRTGHWNADCVGTYIQEGSRIKIDGKWYTILAVTAGQGISADEVTLSRAAASGTVEYIEGYASFSPLAIGAVTPAGFKLNDTTLNADNVLCGFKAIQYND